MRRPRPGRVRAGLIRVRLGRWGLFFRRRSQFDPWMLLLVFDADRNDSLWAYGQPREVRFVPSRPTAADGGGEGKPAAKNSAVWAKVPRLAEHLVSTRYDDGPDQRLPGFLLVRPFGGAWHLTLKEPTAGLQLRVSAETFELALGALEALLGQPAPPWEVDAFAKPLTKKRR